MLAREVAAHKAAEQRLGFASTIIENSPIVIANYRIAESPDHPQIFVPEYVSSNSLQFGYECHDVLSGKVDFFRDVVHPDDRARPLAAIADALRDCQPETNSEYRILTADGRLRWVEGRMKFNRDPRSGALHGQAKLRDITESANRQRPPSGRASNNSVRSPTPRQTPSS